MPGVTYVADFEAKEERQNWRHEMSKRIISIAVMVVMLLTIVPALPGGEADAATYKIKTLTATAKSTSKVALKWSKTTVKSSQYTGYAVFRGGKMIKRVGKKTTSYTDNGLKANTSYKYMIKTYKIKKVTKWYNKKTKKWQTKKPKKKYRGKSKTVKKYTYANPSPSKTVKTKSKPATGGSDSTTIKPMSHDITDGDGTIYAVDADGTYTIPKSGTITDYKGVTRKITYDSKSKSYLANDDFVITSENIARYDKNCNGTFKDGSTVYTQFNGTTITVGKVTNLDYPEIKVEMYNGDSSKLTTQIANAQTVTTYDKDKQPISATFVMKDGKRLIEFLGHKDLQRQGSNYLKRTISFDSPEALLTGVGFVKGTVSLTIKYNGKKIATRKFDANINADARGLSPARQEYLAFAEKAVKDYYGGKKSFGYDMRAICDTISTSYKGTQIGGGNLSCIGAASLLETYSIYEYGEYGFGGRGSAINPNASNYDSHCAFHLDSDPDMYFEAAGTWNP